MVPRRRVREIGMNVVALLRGSAVAMLVVLLAGLATRRSAWPFVNMLLIIPANVLAIAWHEAGHALAARLVGVTPFRVVIGSGRKLFGTNVGGCRVDVHALAFGGLTFVGTRAQTWIRPRYWLTFAGGPAVSLALIAAMFAARGYPPLEQLSASFAPWVVLWFAAWFIAAGSVLPMRLNSAYGELRTDAWVLLTLPFWSAERFADLRIAGDVHEAVEALRERRFPDALTHCDRALAMVPNSYGVRLTRASVFLMNGEAERGRADTLALLDETPPLPSYRMVALNNVAWADLLLDRPELLEEAATFSSRVIRAHPKAAPFLGTRGFALVCLGQFDEAIPLLEKAFVTNLEDYQRALNSACLAMACARRGDAERANDWLERTRELDENCILLSRAVAAVAKGADPADARVTKLARRVAKVHNRKTRRSRAKSRSPYAGVFVIFLAMFILKLTRCGESTEHHTKHGARRATPPRPFSP